MASEPKGLMFVPVWVDDGVIKALVLDTGALPVTETDPVTAVTATLATTTITLKVAEQTPLTELDVTLKASDITLPVSEQSPLTSIFARGFGYTGSSWKKQHLLWGYYDRLAEYDTHVKSGAGSALRTLFTVPANYIYVVKATMSLNRDTIVVQNHLLYSGADYYAIKGFAAQPVGVWAVNDNVDYVMKEGDSLQFQFLACGNLDDLDFAAWGYKMKVDM